MGIKKFLKKVVLAFGLMIMTWGFIYPSTIYAEEIVEMVSDVTFEYGWGYDESENEAKEEALKGAKRRAVEKVYTSYNEDYNEDECSKSIYDEIIDVISLRVAILHEPKFELDIDKRICKVTIDAMVKFDKKDINEILSNKKGLCGCSHRPIIDYYTKAVPFINEDKRVHYYQIVDWGLNWHTAKSECEKAGGHLVTIGSKEEQKFIEKMLRNQGNRNCYWLGGEKIGSKFFWVDNTPFTYTNWAKWQPDNPIEKALMIYKNTNPRAPLHVLGTWADLRADGTFPNENDFFGLDHFGFICEWDS